MCRPKITPVDKYIYIFRPKLNYSMWCLKYRGVDALNTVSCLNVSIIELHTFNNKYMMLVPSKLDASVLCLL